MSFLTAEWRKLILVNYSIDSEILAPYIPKGTELDLYNNTCYISLVGFLFKNTKLLHIPIPFHRNFEEVNLRFYVKYKDNNKWKRGVVFIKEIVPKPALTLVANTIYKEHYETHPMEHYYINDKDYGALEYAWHIKNQRQSIKVIFEKTAHTIPVNSEAEFITEHYFGYTKNKKNTYEYEVTHPRWNQYLIKDYNINVDFKLNYGNSFAFLNYQEPKSILLAEGSKITVENKIKIH